MSGSDVTGANDEMRRGRPNPSYSVIVTSMNSAQAAFTAFADQTQGADRPGALLGDIPKALVDVPEDGLVLGQAAVALAH